MKQQITVGLFCACSLASLHGDRAHKSVLAYYEAQHSRDALTAFHQNIDQLSTDTYNVDSVGNLSGVIPEEAIAFASGNHIPSYLALSNWGGQDFSPSIAHAVLTNGAAQSKAIAGLLDVVSTHGYAGVNMDFESVPAADRPAYSHFLLELSTRLHAAGLKLIVSVPAEQSDRPSDSWAGAFDYKAIGQVSDLVQLMTYDEHGPWGPPGPVAGDDWVRRTVEFAIGMVPRRKLSLGLPAYGYDWNLKAKTGVQIHWNDIPALIAKTRATPQREAGSNAPHFSYTASDGANHEVWYEDTNSISAKANDAVFYNLAGVNEFALGFDDQRFWEAVHRGLNSEQTPLH